MENLTKKQQQKLLEMFYKHYNIYIVNLLYIEILNLKMFYVNTAKNITSI